MAPPNTYEAWRESYHDYLVLAAAMAACLGEKVMAERSQRTEITQDQVLKELARIAFANAGDFFDWNPDGGRRRI